MSIMSRSLSPKTLALEHEAHSGRRLDFCVISFKTTQCSFFLWSRWSLLSVFQQMLSAMKRSKCSKRSAPFFQTLSSLLCAGSMARALLEDLASLATVKRKMSVQLPTSKHLQRLDSLLTTGDGQAFPSTSARESGLQSESQKLRSPL